MYFKRQKNKKSTQKVQLNSDQDDYGEDLEADRVIQLLTV